MKITLWSEQACPVQIWNQDDFRIYLHAKHNIPLEDYIDVNLNNDVMIFSNNVLEKSQSDVDGDYATTYTPSGVEVQQFLRNYHNPHVTQSQLDWIASYIKGEKESNDKLIKNGQLLSINMNYTMFICKIRLSLVVNVSMVL